MYVLFLKGRWRCLLAARELHYDPEMAGKIVVACSVLHNMCIASRLEPVELTAEERNQDRDLQPDVPPAALPPPAAGAAVVADAADALRRGRLALMRLIRSLR